MDAGGRCARQARAAFKGHSKISDMAEGRLGRTERKISIFGKEITMPQSRPVRISIGVALIFFGILGFLPILGFWMIPLGLLVLSYEFAVVRRYRRRLVVWWERRRNRTAD